MQTAAHILCHVCRGEQGKPSHRAHDVVNPNVGRQKERQHDLGHEQNGDERHAAHQLDVENAKPLDRRQIATATEREQNAEREGQHDADEREHEREQQAAPATRRNFRQPTHAAESLQEHERDQKREYPQPADRRAPFWMFASQEKPDDDERKISAEPGKANTNRKRDERDDDQGRQTRGVRDGERSHRAAVHGAGHAHQCRDHRQYDPHTIHLVGRVRTDHEQTNVRGDDIPARARDCPTDQATEDEID